MNATRAAACVAKNSTQGQTKVDKRGRDTAGRNGARTAERRREEGHLPPSSFHRTLTASLDLAHVPFEMISAVGYRVSHVATECTGSRV